MNTAKDFKTVAEEWINTKRIFSSVKNTTLAAYSLSLEKYLIPNFSQMDDIERESVQRFIDQNLKRGISPKRLKDVIMVLKMILKFADERGYCSFHDFPLIYPKENKPNEIEVFSTKHIKILMNYLTSHLTPKNLGILICLNTGMRIGEICGLKWKDIDMKTKLIYINKTICRIYNGKHGTKKSEVIVSTPKTKHSYRTVPITDLLLKNMKILYSETNENSYVLSSKSYPIEPRTYREYFRKLLILLKLPEFKFHTLRHTFATKCVESKCDCKTLSSILGHSKIATTLNLYVHPSQDQKRHCIEKMLKSLRI